MTKTIVPMLMSHSFSWTSFKSFVAWIPVQIDEKSAAGVRTRRGHEQKSDPHNGPARCTRFAGIAQSGPRLRFISSEHANGPALCSRNNGTHAARGRHHLTEQETSWANIWSAGYSVYRCSP